MIDPKTTQIGGRDGDTQRARRLSHAFPRLGITDSGWSALHLDPGDGRFWELTFPEGHLHGGGPPLLRVVSEEEARQKYGDGAVDQGRRHAGQDA
jgi:hypothetical protein